MSDNQLRSILSPPGKRKNKNPVNKKSLADAGAPVRHILFASEHAVESSDASSDVSPVASSQHGQLPTNRISPSQSFPSKMSLMEENGQSNVASTTLSQKQSWSLFNMVGSRRGSHISTTHPPGNMKDHDSEYSNTDAGVAKMSISPSLSPSPSQAPVGWNTSNIPRQESMHFGHDMKTTNHGQPEDVSFRPSEDVKDSEIGHNQAVLDKILPNESTDGITQSNLHTSYSTTIGGTAIPTLSSSHDISESISTKLREMRWCFIALAANSVLVWLIIKLRSGIYAPFPHEFSTSLAGVSIELVFLLTNFMTSRALDDGASAFYGYLLSTRHGYSLAICGFLHGNLFNKIMFGSQLSLNSPIRRGVVRASMVWVAMNVILWLTPLSATALSGQVVRTDSGTVPCIVFHQNSVKPFERGWPTMATEIGASEIMFGSALGLMRSENSDLSHTTVMVSPQIIGAVNDGDTIVGPGFTMDIYSSCSCAQTSDATGIQNVGIDPTIATTLSAQVGALGPEFGLANVLLKPTSWSATTFQAVTAVTGTILCGGTNTTNPAVPICTTSFSNHLQANIMARYSTDGTPASIASIYVEQKDEIGPANMSVWGFYAIQTILKSGSINVPTNDTNVLAMSDVSSAIPLPPTIPSIMSPIAWWMTSNLMAIDSMLIEPGLETVFSIVLRSGIQRTYQTHGDSCIHNIEIPNTSYIRFAFYGYITALIISSVQLAVTVMSLIMFIPWLVSQVPIGPAVRITRDRVYFTVMVYSSGMIKAVDSIGNSSQHVIWQKLDLRARVGESMTTRDDPQYGHVTLDKPKVVAAFTNGKRYV